MNRTSKPTAPASSELLVLHQLIRKVATSLVEQALEEEFTEFMQAHVAATLTTGGQALVRNGYLPERVLLTTVGAVPVRVPRSRDRSEAGIRFTSALLPPYLSRSQLNSELPAIYLRSLLDRDNHALLYALLGSQVNEVSADLKQRILVLWQKECEAWWQRSLTTLSYLCWWAGSVRDEGGDGELLFIVGLQPSGAHELVAVAHTHTAHLDAAWVELLHQLRQQGLRNGPRLADAGQSSGFWTALKQLYPGTLNLDQQAGTVLDQLQSPAVRTSYRYV
ncbi:MAG: transposase [Pseudomonadota bacterium]